MGQMEQRMKIFERLHRLSAEITNRGFDTTVTFNPKELSFDFECRKNLRSIKHERNLRVDSDAPFYIYSDKEFDLWVQQFCRILDGWMHTEKENT